MSFDPKRAEIRFGCGLSPKQAAPGSAEEMLHLLIGPDTAAADYPIPGVEAALSLGKRMSEARRTIRKMPGTPEEEEAFATIKKLRKDSRNSGAYWLGQALTRRALTADGFRERLVSFWSDHFSAAGKNAFLRWAQANFAEDAIRPHVSGRFPEMLQAAVLHPLMLHYLDQSQSVGPNSAFALRRKGKRGLNENLAREVLELHTLGVGGPYTQADISQMAELLTGLSFTLRDGFILKENFIEPGSKTILGKRYDGRDRLEAIRAALFDLALHPATARHLARKMAVHFVGDAPEPDLMVVLERRYADTGGDLVAVYEALLTHPAAWAAGLGNVKQPMDFVGSSLRALDLMPAHVPSGNLRKMQRLFLNPLVMMGQTWARPAGPDGWPEADEDWISPQRLAARLQWAMYAPLRLRRVLPQPADFAEIALGSSATGPVRFAAKAAKTRAEGIGIVLSSPSFQRM